MIQTCWLIWVLALLLIEITRYRNAFLANAYHHNDGDNDDDYYDDDDDNNEYR